jgi:hypothetical protein
VISDVKTELKAEDKMLPTKATTPLSNGYRPELDQSPELDPRRASYFQGIIGMLSRYLPAPREGHLQQVFHIFGYLKTHNKSTLVFDDSEPSFDSARFKKRDWAQFYPGASEAIPLDAPEVQGKAVTTTCFLDADHAGCRVTRRSHSGIIIFVN